MHTSALLGVLHCSYASHPRQLFRAQLGCWFAGQPGTMPVHRLPPSPALVSPASISSTAQLHPTACTAARTRVEGLVKLHQLPAVPRGVHHQAAADLLAALQRNRGAAAAVRHVLGLQAHRGEVGRCCCCPLLLIISAQPNLAQMPALPGWTLAPICSNRFEYSLLQATGRLVHLPPHPRPPWRGGTLRPIRCSAPAACASAWGGPHGRRAASGTCAKEAGGSRSRACQHGQGTVATRTGQLPPSTVASSSHGSSGVCSSQSTICCQCSLPACGSSSSVGMGMPSPGAPAHRAPSASELRYTRARSQV